MYQLHIANKNYSSWSLRPWLLLSELGIPFEERLVTFAQGNGASWQAFRACGVGFTGHRRVSG
jgi:glutathione S-transferase